MFLEFILAEKFSRRILVNADQVHTVVEQTKNKETLICFVAEGGLPVRVQGTFDQVANKFCRPQS